MQFDFISFPEDHPSPPGNILPPGLPPVSPIQYGEILLLKMGVNTEKEIFAGKF